MPTFQIETDQGTLEIETDSSQEEFEAFLGTDEGQALMAEQIAGLPQEEPAADGPIQADENSSGFFQGFGLDKETSDKLASSGPARLLAGVGREVTAIKRGLQQMAGTPQEAKALAALEEKDRAIYEELDSRGIGLEDVGQALPILASVALPGGNAVQAVNIVGKGINALSKLGSTLGGQAAIVAAVEGAKATTQDESRGANAATGAAATVLGGKVAGKLGQSLHAGLIGRMLTVAGLGSIMKGEGGRRAAGGLMSFINRKLLGRESRSVAEESSVRLAASQGGPEARRIVAEGAKAKIGLAGQSGGLETGRSAAWDTFLDVVKGPLNAKGTARLSGKSLIGGGVPKATAAAGVSKETVLAERNRVVGVLLEAAKRPNPQNPQQVLFDAGNLEKAWRELRSQPEFQKAFGSITKTGKFTPNAAAKRVDKMVEDMLARGRAGESPTNVIDGIVNDGTSEIINLSERAIARVANATQKKVDGGFKLSESDIKQRAAAASLSSFVSQEGGFGEAVEALKSGDTWAWIDFTSSWQEQLAELENTE